MQLFEKLETYAIFLEIETDHHHSNPFLVRNVL